MPPPIRPSRIAIQAVAVTVAAAVALAACGSVAARPASGPHSSPGGTPLASATRSAPATPGPRAGSRPQAAALARQLLSRLRLPAGARRLPHIPVPSSLAASAYRQADVTPSLDQYQLFALTQPLDPAAAFSLAENYAGLPLT